jgi:hypothetical protein
MNSVPLVEYFFNLAAVNFSKRLLLLVRFFFNDKLIGVQGARLLENELHIFFVRYKAAEAFLVLRAQRDR